MCDVCCMVGNMWYGGTMELPQSWGSQENCICNGKYLKLPRSYVRLTPWIASLCAPHPPPPQNDLVFNKFMKYREDYRKYAINLFFQILDVLKKGEILSKNIPYERPLNRLKFADNGTDKNGQKGTELNRNRQKRPEMVRNGQEQYETARNGQKPIDWICLGADSVKMQCTVDQSINLIGQPIKVSG